MFIENEKLIKNGFDNYLQNLDDIDPINCEKVIADLSTRLLLGKGIFFDSENKETLSK
jgi:hypothetical protein